MSKRVEKNSLLREKRIRWSLRGNPTTANWGSQCIPMQEQQNQFCLNFPLASAASKQPASDQRPFNGSDPHHCGHIYDFIFWFCITPFGPVASFALSLVRRVAWCLFHQLKMQEECLFGFKNTHTRVKIVVFGQRTLIYWELKCFASLFSRWDEERQGTLRSPQRPGKMAKKYQRTRVYT